MSIKEEAKRYAERDFEDPTETDYIVCVEDFIAGAQCEAVLALVKALEEQAKEDAEQDYESGVAKKALEAWKKANEGI